MRINLSTFKKVSENGESATLKNERGHQITLQKKSLQPHLLKTLATLPLHLAEGTKEEIEEPIIENPTITNVPNGGPAPTPNAAAGPQSESPQGIAAHIGYLIGKHGAPVVSEAFNNAVKYDPYIMAARAGQDFMGGMQQGAGGSGGPPTPQQGNMGPAAPASPPAVDKMMEDKPQGQGPDAYSQFMNGQGQYLSGVRGQAEAEGQLGQRQAGIEHEFGESEKQNFMNYQDHLQDINTERENLIKDIQNDKINPKHYMESMSTPGKVASAIGIVLSGIGSGLTGKDNLAVKYLNDQIDRDINAQRMNLEQKNNLLAANYHREGSLNNALAMTRIQMNDIMAHKIQEEGAKSAYPMAKAKAEQLSGQFLQNSAGMAQQLGMQRMALRQLNGQQGAQMDPSRKLRMLEISGMMPKEDVKTASEELGKAQEMEKLRADVEANAQDLNGKFLAGRLEPKYRDAKIYGLAGTLEKISDGRYNHDSALAKISAFMPGAGDLPETRRAQMQSRQQFFDAMKNTPTLDRYGVQVPRVQKIQEQPPVRGK